MATYLIRFRRLLVCGVTVLALVCVGVVPSVLAQEIVVTSAQPPDAEQGTVNLDVTITGSGFAKGAKAAFLVTGTENPGGVIVNRTTFVNSRQLIANIDVALDAVVGGRDIKVTVQGRTGKGIDCFSVKAKPQPKQWDWQLEVVSVSGGHLVGDGYGNYRDTGAAGDVYVRVSQDTNNSYRFILKILKGRWIGLQDLALSAARPGNDPGTGGYFPTTPGCSDPTPKSCSTDLACDAERLITFLQNLHPICGYAFAYLEINVPVNLESMTPDGSALLVYGHVILEVMKSYVVLGAWDQDFHNMDARDLSTAPLWVQRTGQDSWTIWVDSTEPYLNYAEFYFGWFRGKRSENKIAMVADGPFRFRTIWTRRAVGN